MYRVSDTFGNIFFLITIFEGVLLIFEIGNTKAGKNIFLEKVSHDSWQFNHLWKKNLKEAVAKKPITKNIIKNIIFCKFQIFISKVMFFLLYTRKKMLSNL